MTTVKVSREVAERLRSLNATIAQQEQQLADLRDQLESARTENVQKVLIKDPLATGIALGFGLMISFAAGAIALAVLMIGS